MEGQMANNYEEFTLIGDSSFKNDIKGLSDIANKFGLVTTEANKTKKAVKEVQDAIDGVGKSSKKTADTLADNAAKMPNEIEKVMSVWKKLGYAADSTLFSMVKNIGRSSEAWSLNKQKIEDVSKTLFELKKGSTKFLDSAKLIELQEDLNHLQRVSNEVSATIKKNTKGQTQLLDEEIKATNLLAKAREAAANASLKADVAITSPAALKDRYGKYAYNNYSVQGGSTSVAEQAKAVLAAQTAINTILKSGTTDVKAYEAAIKVLNTELAKLSAVSRQATVDMKPMAGSMEWMAGMAKRALEYVAVYGGIFAVIGGMKQAVAVTVEMEDALYKLAAVMNMSTEQAKQYQDAIIGIGKNVGGTMKELNESALILARAGVAPQDLAKTTESVVRLTALTGDTLASATQGVVSYYEVFGKAAESQGRMAESVDKITASLGYFSNSTRASMADINTFAGYALTAGSAIGADVDLINGMGAALIAAGQSASRAGTNLRRMFTMVNDDGEDAVKVFNTLGISQEKMLKAINEGQGREAFKTYLTELSQLSKEEFNKLTYGMDVLTKESIQSQYNLAKEMIKRVDEATNYTYDEFRKSSEQALASFKTTWDKFKNVVSDAVSEAFEPLLPMFTDVLNSVMALVENLKNSGLLLTIQTLATTIGSLLSSVITGLSYIAPVLSPIVGVFLAWKTATLGLNLALGAAAAGTKAWQAVLSYFSNDAKKASDVVENLSDTAKKTAGGLGILGRVIPIVGFVATIGTMMDLLTKLRATAQLTRQEIAGMPIDKQYQLYQQKSEEAKNSIFGRGRKETEASIALDEVEKQILEAASGGKEQDFINALGLIAKTQTVRKGAFKDLALEYKKSLVGSTTNKKALDIAGTNSGKDKKGGRGDSAESFTAYFEKQVQDLLKGSSDYVDAYTAYTEKIANINNKFNKDGALKDKADSAKAQTLKDLAALRRDLDIQKASEKFTNAMQEIDNSIGIANGTISEYDVSLKKIYDEGADKLVNLGLALSEARGLPYGSKRTEIMAQLQKTMEETGALTAKKIEQAEANQLLKDKQDALTVSLNNIDLAKQIQDVHSITNALYGEAEAVRQLEQEYENKRTEISLKMGAVGDKSEEYKKLKIELDKIDAEEDIKRRKIKAQYSYASVAITTIFNSLNSSIEAGLYNALTGSFTNFGDWATNFFDNLWKDVAKNFSKSLADDLTSVIKGGIGGSDGFLSNLTKGLSLLGDSAGFSSATTLSAGDIDSLLKSGKIAFSEQTGTYTGAGLEIAQDGSVIQDAAGIINGASALNTAYTTLSGGLASFGAKLAYIPAQIMASMGYNQAALNTIQFGMQAGQGMAFNSAAAGTAGGIAGGALSGGLLGYGAGFLGDRLFGAQTQASTGGAIGGALGGGLLMAGAINPLAAVALGVGGAMLGGMFGSKKYTGEGIDIFNASAQGVEGQNYANWKKKSWFSSSSGTEYIPFSEEQKRYITETIKSYDFMLAQLGEVGDTISFGSARFASAQQFVELGVIKQTLSKIMDIPETVTTYVEQFVGGWGDDLENGVLGAFKKVLVPSTTANPVLEKVYTAWADYAKTVNKTIGEAFSETVGGLIQGQRDYTQWQLGFIGDTTGALANQANYASQDLNTLQQSMGLSGITAGNYMANMQAALKSNFTPENIKQWQNLGAAIKTAYDAQMNYQKALLQTAQEGLVKWIAALGAVQNAIDALNPTVQTFAQLSTQSLNADNYQTLLDELEKTRQAEIAKIQDSSSVRVEALEEEMALLNSIYDYAKSLTQMIVTSNEITSTAIFGMIGSAKNTLSTGGKIDFGALTSTASAYLTQSEARSTSKVEYLTEIAKVRDAMLGLTEASQYGSLEGIQAAIELENQSVTNQLQLLNSTALSILNTWKGQAASGVGVAQAEYNARQAEIDRLIAQAQASSYLVPSVQSMVDGSHAAGLDYVPFDGYIAELHKGERVQTVNEVRNDKTMEELKAEISELKAITIKNTAEMTRMSKIFGRLDDGDALKVRVTA
jgi:TP901 family phage tail tape measure protein